MKSINTKLVLSALGVALLATPAFAQRQHHQVPQSQIQDSAAQPNYSTYPNPQTHSGSELSREMGDNTTGGTD
jgi:hypothetical protein